MDDDRSDAEYEDGHVVPGTSYRVVQLLGAGGMGQVYEVEHVEIGRRYVLKTLLSTLALRQDLIQRMRNEWRALGRLQHPNIVDVVHAGTTATAVPFYVMELLDGETLRERLLRERRLAIPEALRIAREVLFGLEAAHQIGIIHRDIKPANIFLTKDGGVKILDFGIAKVRLEGAPKITAQGLAIGTPRYMSPEQAMGGKADARSDLYAVGLLLFEMISGDGPFHESTDSAAQMLAHVNRPPPPLSQRAIVPKDIETVVACSLSKDPAKRPPSAREMALRLEALLPPAEQREAPARQTPAPPRTPGPPQTSPRPAQFSPTPGPTRSGSRPSLREKLFAEAPLGRKEGGSAVPPDAATPGPFARATALLVGLALAGATGFALFHLDDRSDPAAPPPGSAAAPPLPARALVLPAPAASAAVPASAAPAAPSAAAAPSPSMAESSARPGSAKSAAPTGKGPVLARPKTDTLPGSGL